MQARKSPIKPSKDRETAEALALQALAFVIGDEDRLQRFLYETGATPEAIRSKPDDPQLLAAVLDFLLAFDDRLLAFAESAQVKPAAILGARRRLPGADPDR